MNQEEIIQKFKQDIEKTDSLKSVDELRVEYIGRKGLVTNLLRSVGDIPEKDRAAEGQRLNSLKKEIESAIESKQLELRSAQLESEISDSVDITLPGEGHTVGHFHPVQSLQQDLIDIFSQIGFSVADGPEVETDWYCFEALNIPVNHPARDMQDTFYLEDGNIPRTHTSSVQIRYMENNEPPIRIISPGVVYRNEDEDATHSWAFRQIEGLVVDKNISLSDLKGTLLYMLKGILGENIRIKLLPNYFPYVEPALEVHASCILCDGKEASCRMCKGTGWLEMLGAGMVHPQVLRNVGIDPDIYSGFAFGGGIDRIAMIKYQIDDIRYLWRPNLKFLEQF
ncbi:MAG: phenylalanine--tRNA ligase subunit alpha [Candidatus Saccharimonadales bacterium]